MGAVAEHHRRQIGQFHAHHGLAGGEGLDGRGHFGDHHRLVAVGSRRGVAVVMPVVMIFGLGLEDVLFGLDRLRRAFGAGVVVLQPLLVAAQPLGDLVARGVERRVGLGGLADGLNHDAAADMDRDIGLEEMGITGEDDVRLDRPTKILPNDGVEGFGDVAAQGISDVKLLAFDG